MGDVAAVFVGFAQRLRTEGVAVATPQVATAVQALGVLPHPDLSDLYWAGRISLVTRADDLALYSRVFDEYFLRAAAGVVGEQPAAEVSMAATSSGGTGDGADAGGTEPVGLSASEREALRTKRFPDATADELRQMQQLIDRMDIRLPQRKSRRRRPSPRGRHVDVRRSLRRSFATDGELLRRAFRRRRARLRPLVLLLDVSGSMTGYSRALLQFAFSTRLRARSVEVFCFGTRLTRITQQLAGRDFDGALRAAAERVLDWDGGTRIGASVETLNREWGRSGRLRGAVVIICSDGLERGDPDVLRREMPRLARHAYRVVWVNPLKAGAAYEPVQQGMRAALPHVDAFIPGHDLASLDQLVKVLRECR